MNICFLLLILMNLGSCGFKPIYQKDSNYYQHIQAIDIQPLDTIEGAEFFNHLKNILPSTHNSKYQLITSIAFTENYSIIQNNSDILREIVTVRVNFKLIDKMNKAILLNNSFSRPSSYSTTFSPYSNLIQKQEIHKNLSIMVAEEIRNRIIIYFANRDK